MPAGISVVIFIFGGSPEACDVTTSVAAKSRSAFAKPVFTVVPSASGRPRRSSGKKLGERSSDVYPISANRLDSFHSMAAPETRSPVLPSLILSFTAREPSEMARSVRRLAWDSEYLSLDRRFRADVGALQGPGGQLVRASFRSPSLARGGAPADNYVLALRLGGTGRARLGGQCLDDRSVGLIRPGQQYEFHTTEEIDLVILTIPRLHLEHVSRLLWGTGIEAIGRTPTLPTRSPDAIRTLAVRAARQLEGLLCRDAAVADLEARQPIAPLLLDGVLASIAPSPRLAPALGRREAARRAESYMREHWHEALCLADLCTAAGAPERTLRQGFLELYGRGPMAYLRSLRLAAAREMLQASRPELSVGEIALRCGFTHFGRFSVEYRRAYGETPTQTQRRRGERHAAPFASGDRG